MGQLILMAGGPFLNTAPGSSIALEVQIFGMAVRLWIDWEQEYMYRVVKFGT